VNGTKPAMDLISTQVSRQCDIGSSALNMNETCLGTVIDMFDLDGHKLWVSLSPLPIGVCWISVVASEPGAVIKTASVDGMQLTLGGFAYATTLPLTDVIYPELMITAWCT